MLRILLFLLSASLVSGCKSKTETNNNSSADSTHMSAPDEAPLDTTPRVTGIGGIFFKSKNPDSTKNWYAKNLGMVIDKYGSPFEFRNANRQDEINYLEWSAFSEKSTYFNPSKKEFMINYRVQNLSGMLRNLKANGVTILDSVEAVEYGKFVHIMDADGNKIELWEPVDSVLTKLGTKTTK